jgi:hypothetical protein
VVFTRLPQTKSKLTGEKVEIPPAVRKDMSDLFAQIDEDNGGTVRHRRSHSRCRLQRKPNPKRRFDTRLTGGVCRPPEYCRVTERCCMWHA